MKEAKKTPNINIREHSRQSSRAGSSQLRSRPMAPLNQDIRNCKRVNQVKVELPPALKKQFVEAENLTEEEQLNIKRQAQKTANKKLRSTETKVQNEMIYMLQNECNKLGAEVEKEKMENKKLKFQIGQLRKNIDYSSRKLENIYKDNEKLMKNYDHGSMEKGKLNEELCQLRIAYHKLEEDKENQRKQSNSEVKTLRSELEKYVKLSCSLEKTIETRTIQKEDLQEEIKEKNREYQYVKDTFEQRKKEWDRKQQEYELNTRQTLDKKGQKISKYQGQLQILTDKLREEEHTRKKVTDKNQELQRETNKSLETIKQLQDQMVGYKKRVNDLSILKSSNNTIMNQKLLQLSEENTKLKRNIEILQKKGVIYEQASKPILFGSEDAN